MAAGTTPGEVRRIAFLTKEELAVGILIGVFALLGAVRLWGEGQRPATHGSLRASLPRRGEKLRIAATKQNAVRGGMRLQLRALALERYPAEGASSDVSSLTLVLPVSAAACRAWLNQIGRGCNRPSWLHNAELSLTWNEVQAMHLRLRAASEWSLRPSDPRSAEGLPTGWSMESSSGSIRATVTCLEPTAFVLNTSEGNLRSKCVSGGRLLRLVVRPGPGANVLSLHGVKEIHLHAEAGLVSSVVGNGAATADDHEQSVQGLGQRIEMTSDSGPVTVGMDVPASSASRFHADAAVARSVEVGRTEVVPTWFDRYEDLWWAVLIALSVALVGAFWNMYNAESGGSKA
jgi:hypothetical protein